MFSIPVRIEISRAEGARTFLKTDFSIPTGIEKTEFVCKQTLKKTCFRLFIVLALFRARVVRALVVLLIVYATGPADLFKIF